MSMALSLWGVQEVVKRPFLAHLVCAVLLSPVTPSRDKHRYRKGPSIACVGEKLALFLSIKQAFAGARWSSPLSQNGQCSPPCSGLQPYTPALTNAWLQSDTAGFVVCVVWLDVSERPMEVSNVWPLCNGLGVVVWGYILNGLGLHISEQPRTYK